MTPKNRRPCLPGRAMMAVLVGISLLTVWGCELKKDRRPPQRQDVSNQEVLPLNPRNDLIQQAFKEQKSDMMVLGVGYVVEILPDDTRGVRHQRFIVKLDNGLKLLVTHNIDIAARVKKLKKNDLVTFKGEYIWNEKGGIIHWTHLDPLKEREGGWIEHKGKKYE